MKPYSPDLRQKIVDAVNSGLTHEEVAARFGVSTDSVSRYHKQWRETGDLTPRPVPGPQPRIARDDYPKLAALLDAHDDATLAEHCALWHDAGHLLVSPSTMCRAQQKLGWTRKKRPSPPVNAMRRHGLPSGTSSPNSPAKMSSWWMRWAARSR